MKMDSKKKRLIFTGLSCLGVVGTALSVHHNTKKSLSKPEEDRSWKDYILSGAVGLGTIGVIVFNHKETNKELVALMGTAAMATEYLNTWKNVTKEEVGEEKYKDICKKVVQQTEAQNLGASGGMYAINHLISGGNDLFRLTLPLFTPKKGWTGDNDDPYVYYWSERPDYEIDVWFRSNLADVRSAMLHFNRNFHLIGSVELEQLIDFLGIHLEPEDLWYAKTNGYGFSLIEQEIYWIDHDEVQSTDENGEDYIWIQLVEAPYPLPEMDVPQMYM